MNFIIIVLGIALAVCICIKLLIIIGCGIFCLCVRIGYYIEDYMDNKKIVKDMEDKQRAKRCENCKYWEQDDSEYQYNDNFGYCCCKKIEYRENLEKKLEEKLGYDFDKKEYDNYYAIYSDSEGLAADLRVHKKFGCICFSKNKKRRKEVNA